MSKNVSYSLVARKNPADQSSFPKFYAQSIAKGDVTIDEIAHRIEKTCTVTRADVMAVLTALEDRFTEALQNGEIVRLANIGSFQIVLRGKGSLTEKEYDTSLIERARINFRPGLALKGILNELSYARIDKKSTTADSESDSNQNEDEGL